MYIPSNPSPRWYEEWEWYQLDPGITAFHLYENLLKQNRILDKVYVMHLQEYKLTTNKDQIFNENTYFVPGNIGHCVM